MLFTEVHVLDHFCHPMSINLLILLSYRRACNHPCSKHLTQICDSEFVFGLFLDFGCLVLPVANRSGQTSISWNFSVNLRRVSGHVLDVTSLCPRCVDARVKQLLCDEFLSDS